MRLFAADSETVHSDRWRGYRSAEFQVAGDFRDVEEQVFEISGHRDFFNGVGEFAAGDPEAGGAAGIISGDEVHALSEEFGDVESFFYSSD
jgi:hypothetical protein